MTDEAIWDTDGGCFLRVVVKPKSHEQKLIAEIEPSWVVVNLKSAARKGKANTELIKRISKLLDKSTSEVILVRGHRSREKILQIVGLSGEELMSILTTSHKQ